MLFHLFVADTASGSATGAFVSSCATGAATVDATGQAPRPQQH